MAESLPFKRGGAGARWWRALVLVLALAGCATPPHRDFAAANGTAPSTATQVRGAAWPQSEPIEDLAPVLRPHLDDGGVPALAAAVVRGDRIIARGAVGVRRAGRDEAVTAHDRFGIASCGKAFSATLLAKLAESGSIAWHTPIRAYAGDVAVHRDWDNVTLQHLLNHRAGLRDPLGRFLLTTYTARGSLSERRWLFARRLLAAGPAAPPGQGTRYSNAGYMLAAALVEHTMQESWEELMLGFLRNDLGLASAGYGPPGEPGSVTEPWGHGKRRVLQVGLLGATAYDPGARSADYPAIASPAGYLHLTIDDWASFAALHLRAHLSNPHHQVQVLEEASFAVLHAPAPHSDYAGGWYVSTRAWARGKRPDDVGRVLYHLGNNGRWSSAAWLAPELDLAIVVTGNRGDALATIDRVVGALVANYSRSPE